jgi:hypothetical protein
VFWLGLNYGVQAGSGLIRVPEKVIIFIIKPVTFSVELQNLQKILKSRLSTKTYWYSLWKQNNILWWVVSKTWWTEPVVWPL